jgi:hypothetical protein
MYLTTLPSNSPLLALSVVAVAALGGRSGCTAGCTAGCTGCRHGETGSRLRLDYHSATVGAGPVSTKEVIYLPGGPLDDGSTEWEEMMAIWTRGGPLEFSEWEQMMAIWTRGGPLEFSEWELVVGT